MYHGKQGIFFSLKAWKARNMILHGEARSTITGYGSFDERCKCQISNFSVSISGHNQWLLLIQATEILRNQSDKSQCFNSRVLEFVVLMAKEILVYSSKGNIYMQNWQRLPRLWSMLGMGPYLFLSEKKCSEETCTTTQTISFTSFTNSENPFVIIYQLQITR